ncbi:hypothetical protein CPB85DRAFT_1285453 [Mucidula mucida]|nr:hypothetical protein CPB85DRAFT_1285453 [Mucidula mucida]
MASRKPTRILKKIMFEAYEDESMKDISFPHFPSTSSEPLLILPFDPQMNNSEGLPEKFPFPDVLAWGDGLDNESSIFFDGYFSEGDEQKRFCVKVLFNIEKAKPDDYSLQAFHNMLADAKFHAQNLRAVAGVLVPRHYGLWCARTKHWGGTVLCSVTEWAGIPWDRVAAMGYDLTSVKKLFGRTVEQLHDFGVHHNHLHYSGQLHHVLFRRDQTTAGPITRCFVVDFSEARTVPCTRNLPILRVDADIRRDIGGCREALDVQYLLEMYEKDVEISPSTHTYKALRFHKRYSALHPSLRNKDVMTVQRHHFFKDELPLDLNIKFDFQPDGKVVSWKGHKEDSDKLAKRLPDDYIASLLV